MKTNRLTQAVLAVLLGTGLSSSILANEENDAATNQSAEFFGNLRLGFITAEDDAGDSTDGSAIGGKLGFVSPSKSGFSVGATAYLTQELFDDENGYFFGADGSGYAILGEAYLQGRWGNTQVKAGRFEFDSPHADTDDISMIPNTFSGVLISNSDLTDTTLYFAHLDEWAGVDTDEPEEFNEINGDDGLTTLGVVYEGVENLALQAWYYRANELVDLFYLEAMYEAGNLAFGAQYASQSDETLDNSGPDGDLFGLTASYNINDFTLVAAYNSVSGVVSNGFGGGPFFTSAEDHTVDGVDDQKAFVVGLEYSGVENLTLGVLSADFDKGEDEIDFYAAYDIQENMSLEMVYADMNDDGNIFRLMFNFGF